MRNYAHLILTLSAGISLAQAQVGNSINLSVDDPRPLAAVADAMQLKTGVTITYEDPPLANAADIRDVTAAVGKGRTAPETKVLVPRGGPLSMDYAADKTGRPLNLPGVLQDAIRSYSQQELPGTFRVVNSGESLHIIPQSARGLNGALQDVHSILDTPVSVNLKQATLYNAFVTVFDAINRATGQKIVVGTAPATLLLQRKVTLNENDQTARTILVKLLNSSNWTTSSVEGPPQKLTWRLFYDPFGKTYGMNLAIVFVETASPYGGTITIPAK